MSRTARPLAGAVGDTVVAAVAVVSVSAAIARLVAENALRASRIALSRRQHVPVVRPALARGLHVADEVRAVGMHRLAALADTLLPSTAAAVLSHLDVAGLVERYVDVDRIARLLDVDAVAARLDVGRVVERVDIDAIASGLDLNTLVEKVDIGRVIDRVDLDEIVSRVDIGRVIDRVDLDEIVSSTRVSTVDRVMTGSTWTGDRPRRPRRDRVPGRHRAGDRPRRPRRDRLPGRHRTGSSTASTSTRSSSRVDIGRVIDRVDLDEIVSRVDIDRIAARLDLDPVIERANIVAIARYVVQAIDLPALIRSSTASLSTDVVRGVRDQGADADRAVERLVDRLLLRRHGRHDGEPELQP